MDLVERLLSGDRRALARALSLVEDEAKEARAVLSALYPHTGGAHIVGITGAPGTGKSTLVSQLAKRYRERGQTVGIIAVDPTSPFSGGALLGDRLRMRDLAGDSGIFIGSMATRGSLGGLARSTTAAAHVLDAAGYQRILVETVGAGQAEVDIAATAHTTVVVEAPGLGDDIQAIKAGILEIANVFAVNKADRDGVERTVLALRAMLDLGVPSVGHHGVGVSDQMDGPDSDSDSMDAWVPPICRTVATEGKGIPDLLEAIEAHATHLRESGQWRLVEAWRARIDLERILQRELLQRLLSAVSADELESLVEGISQREVDPYQAAAQLMSQVEQRTETERA